MHKNIVCTCHYSLVQRRKIRRKSNEFQGLVSQELLELFLSNLVCKVLYMKALKYLVEIDVMIFEFMIRRLKSAT